MTTRQRKGKKRQGIINLNNKVLAKFLKENGYTVNFKSLTLAKSIIPEHLLSYWLLGLFDGDGCIYIKPAKLYQLSIAGNYEQNWSPIEDIFNSIGIKYKIRRRIQGKNKSSVIRITNKSGIKALTAFMIKDFPSLARKKTKLLSI